MVDTWQQSTQIKNHRTYHQLECRSLNFTLASAANMTHPTLATCIALPIRACGSLLGSGTQRCTPAAAAQSSKLGKPIMQYFSVHVSQRRNFDDQIRGDPVRVNVGNLPT